MTFLKTAKRFISFILIFCMILSILPCDALAADVVNGFSADAVEQWETETEQDQESEENESMIPEESYETEETAAPKDSSVPEEPAVPEESFEPKESSEMEAASFLEGAIGCVGDDIPRVAPDGPVEEGISDPGQPVVMSDVPYVTSEQAGEAVRYSVLVLDTSATSSFLDANGRVFYVADTAIDYVKASAKKFVSDVQKADGINYVAVVEYKSTASNIVSGFTTDYDTLNLTIDGLYSSGNTRSVAYGLQKVNSLLDAIPDPDAIKNVVLFTTGMTNEGPYSYSGRYDGNTVGSNWRRTDTQVRLYAYANSAIAEAETLKDKATLYTVGLFQVMEDMPQTGREVVEFFKLFAKDMATSENYFYDVRDPSQLEFVFGDIADDIINGKKTGTFMFPSDDEESKKNPEKKQDYAATYYYDDNYFSTEATIYNPSLSTMSLCFALSAFGSNLDGTTNYKNKSRNAKALLDAIGFKDIETNKFFTEKPSEDSMGVIIGHKDIMVEETPYTLIALATRGGGYEAEWAGNFTIGASGQHQGFETAKKEAYRFLDEYINAHKDDFQDNVKIWMAGYSRAGATANMLAGQLDDDKYIAGIDLSKEDIYAYCFEPPMGAMFSDVLPISNYDNIHNIVNPSDLVPKVAPRVWSFARYGVDEPVIPTRLTSSNRADYDAMLEKFKALNTAGSNESLTNGGTKHIVDTFQAKKIDVGVDVNFDWGHWEKRIGWLDIPYYVYVNDTTIDPHLISDDGKDMSAFLDDVILSLAVGIGDRENYTQNLQAAMRLVMAETLGGGYESYKWDKVPDILYKKLLDHLLDLAYQLVVDGVNGVENLVMEYLVESIEEAGIDLDAYASIPGALGEALLSLVRTIVASVLVSGGNDLITLAYNAGKLFFAHYPELCLAWLQMQDVNYTPGGDRLFVIDAYRIIRINCPVDIEVLDEARTCVARFIDDVPQDTGSTIVAAYTSDGEKVIYLPADQDYDIRIVATEDGELNYSVSEFSYETFSYSRLVNYNDIAITAGNVLEASVDKFLPDETTNTSQGSARNYSLILSGSALIPDVDVVGETAANALFRVSVENGNAEGGMVLGGGAYTQDSFAQVSATPYEDCEFDGWYVDGTLVSTDAIYRFAVQGDTSLTAQFTGVRVTPENSPDSFSLLTMEAGVGGSITKGATGYYTPGSVVTITAVADAGYEFAGWTSSGDVTFADASNANTTFVMPVNDVTVTATFRSEGSTTTYTVAVDASPAVGGTVTGNGTYGEGESVTVTAYANSGYRFVRWTEGSATVSTNTSYTFTVRHDVELIAVFELIDGGSSGWNHGGGYYGGSSSSNPSYQITVSTASNGTVTVSPTSAKSGTKVTITATPNDGYTTGSVTVTNSSGKNISITDNGNGTYTFTMPASKVTVSVTFATTEVPNPSTDVPVETPWVNPFTDVSSADWFYSSVQYVHENGLMTGDGSPTIFNPNGATTRGMIMTILARVEGIDTSGSTPWYQTGMEWAMRSGVSDGTNPEAPITREELATMLWRYAGEPAATGDLTTYPDAASVQDWASTAMAWAVQNGIINGIDGKLDPHGRAIRSQTAAMLTRFCKNIET